MPCARRLSSARRGAELKGGESLWPQMPARGHSGAAGADSALHEAQSTGPSYLLPPLSRRPTAYNASASGVPELDSGHASSYICPQARDVA